MSDQERVPYKPEYNQDENLDINVPFKIDEVAAWMDGGSVTAYCTNNDGVKFNVHFQHYSTIFNPGEHLPGRLSLAGQLVPVRSALEAKLLDQLAKAPIDIFHDREDWQKLQKEVINHLIGKVRSEEYVDFDRKIQAILASQKK